jgi:putative membrane protein
MTTPGRKARHLGLVAAGLLVGMAGCNTGANGPDASAAVVDEGVPAAPTDGAAAPPGDGAITSTGDGGASFAPTRPGQLASVLHAANRVVMDEAPLASGRTSNASILSFAQRLFDEHAANDQHEMALLNSVGVAMEENPATSWLQQTATTDVEALTPLTEHAFDRAFIEAQVRTLQTTLDLIDRSPPATANNPLFRDYVENTRAIVDEHLQAAQEILASLQD